MTTASPCGTPNTGERLTWIYTPAPMLAAALSPEHRFVAGGCYEVWIWDLESPPRDLNCFEDENLGVDITLPGHPAGLSALAYSPDGTRIATGGAEGAGHELHLSDWTTITNAILHHISL